VPGRGVEAAAENGSERGEDCGADRLVVGGSYSVAAMAGTERAGVDKERVEAGMARTISVSFSANLASCWVRSVVNSSRSAGSRPNSSW
jgi:hypothetical protein